MTCDPQTLSRLISCLRCLTDAQLMIARTYLLCQWAQRVSGATTPGTPTNPDIGAGSSSDNVIFTWANGSPVGTTNEIWKSTDGTNFVLFATVAGGIIQKVDNTNMAAGNIWYYKVRSCNGSTCSAFSSVVSVSFNYTSANVASINFPTLIRAFGFFTADGLAALTSVSLPALKSVQGNLDLANNANLTSVTLTSLTSVANLYLGSDNLTGAVSLPALLVVAGDLQVQGNILVTSFSAPVLSSISGNLVMSGMSAMTSVTLTLLHDVGMSNASGRLDFSNDDALTTLSLPALVQVFSEIDFDNSSVLASVQLPVLTTIVGDNFFVISGFLCPLLTVFNAPNWIIADTFWIDLNSCALLAASINQVLARGVASGVTSCQFTLNGGTNAAPTGQGVADKATLIGLGNTVNTN